MTGHAALAALILAVLVVAVLLLWPRSEKPEPISAQPSNSLRLQ
jgi:hypothetical protein